MSEPVGVGGDEGEDVSEQCAPRLGRLLVGKLVLVLAVVVLVVVLVVVVVVRVGIVLVRGAQHVLRHAMNDSCSPGPTTGFERSKSL